MSIIYPSITIAPDRTGLTTVALLHLSEQTVDAVQAVIADLERHLTTNPGCRGLGVLVGTDRRRIAIYVQWESGRDATRFLESGERRELERRLHGAGAVGAFRAYLVDYVNDSLHGPMSLFSRDYPGVLAINEVTTHNPADQPDLTRVMIRTDSVARRMPFHHATNLHVSTDGHDNLNVLQFRYSVVRLVLWVILRFGRTTEALRYGTPDVHFYELRTCWSRALARTVVQGLG
ncbi:MAG: antibiotic biosynthesis monooxygenase [Nocardioides sp.]